MSEIKTAELKTATHTQLYEGRIPGTLITIKNFGLITRRPTVLRAHTPASFID